MTTTRIREKISALVSSQLPEFIQSDFPTFVSFIEAYYKFLEQDQGALELVQNARSYNDIDSTTEDFVKFFLKNYTLNFPENTLVNKRFLVKKVNDIYTAKGSSLSFDVLFRTVFDTSVEIKTPFDFVLRASDGRWEQRVSLRIKTLTGNRNDLQNRIITYQLNGILYQTPIINVKNLTSTLTETFLDRNLAAPSYNVGDTISVFNGSGNVIFTGVIEPTTTNFSILRPGSGFKVGQVYTISYGGAVDTIIKITKVTPTGGIEEIKFLVYGHGFDIADDPLLLDFDPTKNFSEVVDAFADSTGGFTTELTVTDLFQDYFLEDYVAPGYLKGNILSSAFTTSAFTPSILASKPPQIASISFRFGALGRYPGQFTRENGFLSEPDVRLQDSLLFQAFAYQTNTDIDREDFFDVVKKLIHPAGQNLFNNRILEANIDFSGNVSLAFISNVFFEATDSFAVLESSVYNLSKDFTDDVQTQDDNLDYVLSKPEDDSVIIVEIPSIEFSFANVDDSASITDNFIVGLMSFREFTEQRSSDYFLQFYAEDYSVVTGMLMTDFLSQIEIQLNFVDQITINDKFIFIPPQTTIINVNENTSIELENNGIADDSVSFNDPITVGFFVTREFLEQRSNDYFLEVYAEDYAQVSGFIFNDDDIFISLASSLVSNTGTSDLLSMVRLDQTYADLDYFSELYVAEEVVIV